jgi:eukaryotic-like serine/threonine-protein kinase
MISENDLQAGDILGGFKIEKILGRGGMGVVFKAHELTLNRKIALKVLASRLSASAEFLQRFKREAQVIASLKHANIVDILSYGEEQGLHFFAMEYIKGKDLREILKENPLMPYEEALNIVRQVADALSEAGSKGVVHRDIKPSNIMIDSMGRAYVTDFGVACFEESSEKLTQTGLFLGTPEYASPEQAKGLALDVRSDIYSLGAVLYRMLSGRPPVSGDSPLAVMVKISTEAVTPIAQINPSVPKPICALIEKMMAKEVKERYPSPKALLEDIDRCLDQLRNAGATSPLVENPFEDAPEKGAVSAKPRRNLVGIAGAVLGIAMAVFLIVWLVEGGSLLRTDPAPVQKTVPQEIAAKDSETAQTDTGTDHSIQQEQAVSVPQETPTAAFTSEKVDAADLSDPSKQPAKQPDGQTDGQTDGGTRADAAQEPAGVLPALVAAATPPATQAVAIAPAPRTPAAKSVGMEAPPAKSSPPPTDPVILVVVSGEESMTSLTRNYLHTQLRGSGLKILTPAEVPVLRERMRVGDLPISWYDIHRIFPPGRAQVLMLAEIVQTGVMPIRYMGRSDELIRAAFTLQAIDMASGESIHSSASDTIQFTALNMDQKLKEGIIAAARGIDTEIRTYWGERR